MKFLAIDTSCDDTSVAVTENTAILANVISSQVKEHAEFGGVVPFLAQRLHRERINKVIELAFRESGVTWNDIDAIAVTYGPGLAPALEVGLEKALELAQSHEKPLYAVNHMAGHLAACFGVVEPQYPLLALLLSGNHSELVLCESFGHFSIIGQTLDDALGEAYDKVARMLGLGYPGGQALADLASRGNADAYELPVPMKQSGDLNLSYSGLKNAVRLLVEREQPLDDKKKADIAAGFERVAQESVLLKLKNALQLNPEVRQLVLGGGVAANTVLRGKLKVICEEHGVEFLYPEDFNLCRDNGAMIGMAAWFGVQAGQKPVETADRVPYLSLEDTTF